MNPYLNPHGHGENMHDMADSDDESQEDTKPRKGKGKAGDGEGGDGKEKKGINRVNRACNNCRRMKMRCIGADDPPCKRCRNSGLACVMEKPGRGGAGGHGNNSEGAGDDRIRSLENQVSSMQNTLVDLVKTLQAGMSTSNNPGSSHPPQISSDFSNFGISGSNMPSMGFPSMSGESPSAFDPQYRHHSSTGSDPTPPFYNMGGNGNNPIFVAQSPSNSAGSFNQIGGMGWANQQNQASTGFANVPIDPALLSAGMGTDPPKQNAPPAPSHAEAWPQETSTKGQNLHMSLPPSRMGSVTPDDILAPEEIINPLGVMTNMAGLVEAAAKRARQDEGEPTAPASGDVENTGLIDGITKKGRRSPILPHGPIIMESQNLPPQSTKEKGKKGSKKRHMHAYPDAVEEGFVTEQEGKELMAIFYAGSSNFIPCYDPAVDTWESLRARSPFSITAIIMVGARVRDGGGAISDAQRLCREHAQRIAVGTLFNPVARIEAVQAMIMLAAFSENGWLPGGHAVRMAIDMGLNRSFLSLLRTGMGKGKTPADLEEERHLVVQSRIWFCLYLIEHQMAYGMGRPAILREDETIHQCRRLLEHPLSITSDARLVSTVELMALRAPLHIELTAAPDLPIAENTMRRLKQANADFDAWERYWDRVLGDRFGKGRGDFFRESLIIQRQYAELFVNSQLLRGIKEPTDVVNMPEEKRALAIRAMRNAQRCIEICLRGENELKGQYRNGLRYAVHYTHVCAAFAASFLIRIARLFPHELNLKKTAKDVDELADVLSGVPAGRYARSLRLILRRARRAKVIPAASRAPSPGKTLSALPASTPSGSTEIPFSPSQLINPNFFSPAASNKPPATVVGLSPTAARLQQSGNMMNTSPESGTDMFEFDQLFAQETMERAGLANDGDELPLFLDGHSLGGQQAGNDFMPFVGMEQFFLPAVVDNRLAGPGVIDQNGSALAGLDPSLLGEDVWW